MSTDQTTPASRVDAPRPITLGTSPKAIAAALAALLAPIIAAALAKTVGIALDVGFLTTVIGGVLVSAITFASARLAPAGDVVYPDPVHPADLDQAVAPDEPDGEYRPSGSQGPPDEIPALDEIGPTEDGH